MSWEYALREAADKGLRAARQNLVPMLALEAAMALRVIIYYFWPEERPLWTVMPPGNNRAAFWSPRSPRP